MKKFLAFYKQYEEIINYLIIGGITTVISLVTYYLLISTFLDASIALELQVANIISWLICVIFAYFTNRIFVFKSNNDNKLKEIISFTSSRVLTLLLDMLIMFVFVTLLKGNDKIFKIISQIVVIIVNYIISKLIVFRKK